MTSGEAVAEPGSTAQAPQIRGSSLLLAGRIISLGVGFLAQVIVVRYLTKGDYGAFAYALAVVSLLASVAAFGLDKATSRFLPMYDEAGDRGRGLGMLAFAAVVMAAIGATLVVAVWLGRGLFDQVADATSVGVLAILVVLTPVQALDPLFTATLAVLAHPRVIFFRRYLLEPVLELTMLAVVLATAGSVFALATGYVFIGVLGLAIYAVVVLSRLRRAGYLSSDARRESVVPWREVLPFSLPLLSSDLVLVLRGALVVILLEVYGTATDVADFRSVFPQARLNLVVMQSFAFLYLPVVARLHARGDPAGMRTAHRQSSAWITLMSFPPFAASFALAAPVVELVYGAQYASSAPILAILSAGFFASAALGLSGLSLRAIGRVRYIVLVDTVVAVASVACYLVLIPPFGALGAAIGTTATLIAQAVAYHLGAVRAGVTGGGRGALSVLLGVAAIAAVGLAAMQALVQPPLVLGILAIGVVWVALLIVYRGDLDLLGTFPELRRVPVVRTLAGGRLPGARGSGGRAGGGS